MQIIMIVILVSLMSVPILWLMVVKKHFQNFFCRRSLKMSTANVLVGVVIVFQAITDLIDQQIHFLVTNLHGRFGG